MSDNKSLQKSIGLFDAVAIVVGMVIGSGVFFKPSIVFKNAGSPALGVIAWIVSGIITMASGLTIAEIAAAIPKTGGVFIYLKELYGEKIGFLFGWVETVIYIPGAAAALAMMMVSQMNDFVSLTKSQEMMVSIGILLFIMGLNLLSTKVVSKLQGLITVVKLLPIAFIIFWGIFKGTANGVTFTFAKGSVPTLAGFGVAMLGTLWAYDGWINVGNMAGELKNPKKDLPKCIIIGIFITALVYVLVNIALVKVLPIESIINSSKPASDAATILVGGVGGKIISAGIIIAIFGTLNAYVMTGIRVPYAMAKDNLMPCSKFFEKISGNNGIPVNALMLQTVLSCLYVLSGSFDILSDLVMFVLWIFFTMAVAGIFILRTKFKNIERPYTVPLYPIVPIVSILGSSFIIVSTLINNTKYAVFGIIITLIGLPVYSFIKKKNNNIKTNKSL